MEHQYCMQMQLEDYGVAVCLSCVSMRRSGLGSSLGPRPGWVWPGNEARLGRELVTRYCLSPEGELDGNLETERLYKQGKTPGRLYEQLAGCWMFISQPASGCLPHLVVFL